MGYIDKLDWHIDSAMENGLSEKLAIKSIANYMGCFLLSLVDFDLLNSDIYKKEDLIKMSSYMDSEIIDIEDFFGNWFDYKISKDVFNEKGLIFVENYYDNFKYLEDYEKIFKPGDSDLFFSGKITKNNFLKLKNIIEGKIGIKKNKSFWKKIFGK